LWENARDPRFIKNSALAENDRIKIIQKFLKEREETFPKKFPRTPPKGEKYG
jgi:hypothetical protein